MRKNVTARQDNLSPGRNPAPRADLAPTAYVTTTSRTSAQEEHRP